MAQVGEIEGLSDGAVVAEWVFAAVVIVGVILERWSPGMGSWMVAGGIAFEVLAGMVAHLCSGELTRRTNEKLTQAETARRATQVRLAAVGKLLADRRIWMGAKEEDGPIRQECFKALEQFAGTIALIQPVEGREPSVLASDIFHAVSNRGWAPAIIGRTGIGIIEYPPGLIMPGVAIVFMAGPSPKVGVPHEPNQLFHAARALQNLLALDLEPPWGVTFQPQFSDLPAIWRNSSFTLQDDALLVLVGDKPVAATLLSADTQASRIMEGTAT